MTTFDFMKAAAEDAEDEGYARGRFEALTEAAEIVQLAMTLYPNPSWARAALADVRQAIEALRDKQ